MELNGCVSPLRQPCDPSRCGPPGDVTEGFVMESEVQWITLGTITADTQQVRGYTNTAKDTKDRCPDLWFNPQ